MITRRCMKCGQPSMEFAVCWRCYSRFEAYVSVRASMKEIEALGPQRTDAFLKGIAAVISAESDKT